MCACSGPSNHRNNGSGVLLKNVRSSISTGMLPVNSFGTRETSNSESAHSFSRPVYSPSSANATIDLSNSLLKRTFPLSFFPRNSC